MKILQSARIDLLNTSSAPYATYNMLFAGKPCRERSVPPYTWLTQPEKRTIQSFEVDAPAESANPFPGIHAIVTHGLTNGVLDPNDRPPEQSRAIPDAIECFTIGVTLTLSTENLESQWVKGYTADRTILEKNLIICNPEEMKVFRSSATMVGIVIGFGVERRC